MNKPAPKNLTRNQLEIILQKIAIQYTWKEAMLYCIYTGSSYKNYLDEQGVIVELEYKIARKLEINIILSVNTSTNEFKQ